MGRWFESNTTRYEGRLERRFPAMEISKTATGRGLILARGLGCQNKVVRSRSKTPKLFGSGSSAVRTLKTQLARVPFRDDGSTPPAPSTVREQRHKLSEDKRCLSCHAFPCAATKLRERSQQKRVGATVLGPVGEWLSHIPFTDGIVGSNPIGTIMRESE